jgi:hypothetical protein
MLRRTFLESLSAAGLAVLSQNAKAVAAEPVQCTWGLDVINAITKDPHNVLLPILQCHLDGFLNDWAEYRTRSVKRIATHGSIIATVPAAGIYYPGFIFYDGEGDERFGIFIDGVEKGVAIANVDDNRQYLFFLTEPETFRGGEKMELRTLTSQGSYRTEDLILLKEKPSPGKRIYTIREVAVQPGARSASLTWITNWPVACAVEWSGGQLTEEQPAANHRLVLQNLRSGQTYCFRVLGLTREGRIVESAWQTFRTGEPPELAGQVTSARVTLKIQGDGPAVTSGVPFPKGALGSDRQLRLLDEQGSEIPVQTRTLGRWGDGSVKWALLDFQPKQPSVVIEYGTEITCRNFPSPLRVTEDARQVTVNTGPLDFTLSKRRFGFLESVWLNGEQLTLEGQPSAFYLTGSDKAVYSTLAPPGRTRSGRAWAAAHRGAGKRPPRGEWVQAVRVHGELPRLCKPAVSVGVAYIGQYQWGERIHYHQQSLPAVATRREGDPTDASATAHSCGYR